MDGTGEMAVLKAWREVAVPHEDIRRGKFDASVIAAARRSALRLASLARTAVPAGTSMAADRNTRIMPMRLASSL